MDDFTKRILEKAENRSKVLGISKVSTIHPTQNVLSEMDTTDSINENSVNLKNVLKSNKLERNNSIEGTRHFVSVGDKENVDVGIEINITTGSNVEVQVDVAEKTEEGMEIRSNRKVNYKMDGQSSSFLPTIRETEPTLSQSSNVFRESSRNRLQRLGNLYSSTDLSSPIHRTEGNFHENIVTDGEVILSSAKRTKKVNGKLAALANSIKNWEDDTSHPNYKQATLENRANQGRASNSESSDNRCENRAAVISCSSDDNNSSNRVTIIENSNQLPWDKKVIDSLQAQGFQKRESKNLKYCYEFENRNKKENKASPKKSNIEKYVNESDPKPQNVTSGKVLNRAAIFENISKSSVTSSNKSAPHKDPAEMSLKERMMLFEKNRGEALIPKSSFAMPIPINNPSKDQPKSTLKSTTSSVTPTCVLQARNIFEGKAQGNCGDNIFGGNLAKGRDNGKEKKFINQKFIEDHAINKNENETRTSNKNEGNQTIKNVHYTETSNEQNLGGSNKRKSPSYKSENVTNSEGDKPKLLKTNERSGRLYPILSELELEKQPTDESSEKSKESFSSKYSTNEEEYNSDSSNEDMGITDSSLGRKIQDVLRSHEQRVCFKDLEDYEPNRQYEDNSTDVSASTETNDVDDFLDEALEDDSEDENSFRISRRKSHQGTKCSDSFSFKKPQNSPRKNEEKEEEGTDSDTLLASNEDNVIKLVHTVSFYRRQQSSNTPVTTPSKKIQKTSHIRREVTPEESNEDDMMESDEESHLVEEKIQKLLDEVCKQQQIIAQTSHALNWCASTIEFSGSTEAVEGERHLLVATHRRQAALDEVQRLKVEKRIRLPGTPKEQGKLTVREITLPLKQDYIRKLAADTISGHHLVCLLKYNENVLATKTIPTLPGLLAVKFPDVLQLNSAYADFRITLEIYGMTAQREILPHEVKYHINVNKKSGNKTPKRKGTDSRLIMPIRQSPAGPHVVRTPALVQYAFAIFSLREIQRSTWTLTQVSGVSPLEGTVHMKIHCELNVCLEHKGFLTMFEEISGFGAWHRRWCHLNGHLLNYWKYPDDESKKTPMGSIDLSTSVCSKVTTAPRDVCARLNTILLECQRERKSSDVESLILIPKGNITIVRYLLSADTKEDREDWTNHFNKALTLLKAWGTGSKK